MSNKDLKDWGGLASRIIKNWGTALKQTTTGEMPLHKFTRLIKIGTKNLIKRFPRRDK